ncbi:hypothetical protein SAMN05216369_0610 [Marinobacter antarcticus]|uniref:Uncharacterized protein n=1 Tax=Marinobacter antarcticus TaxID=564117 RepID=A0A1M6Q021_9GAMM|nr:hypothetical protein [Marinobacter antarcticus]SHK13466.1 hypothetical protein SAMN05216369_0610 [Marinobacter antarcticus]
MNQPKGISWWSFEDKLNPIRILEETHQKKYIISYLSGAGAKTILVEENYFDRDYLDEFSSFYSRVAVGYPNVCKRLHIFGPNEIDRDGFLESLNASDEEKVLQNNYLGFIVLRPIPSAPFGRTVLALYPDKMPETPRITEPARDYHVHIAGVQLSVKGLAWQQQDTGVAACATIGLWTMFHSSALDDHHAIPTTAEITTSAEQFGARAFPSKGMTMNQILEAIHRQNFNPVAVSGDINKGGVVVGFSEKRFSINCMSFIRSGYPVLLLGHNGSGGHAICLVGARENQVGEDNNEAVCAEDENSIYFYVHDDNYGPNIRFRLKMNNGISYLSAEPPAYVQPGYPDQETCFFPTHLIVATNKDVRVDADDLYLRAERCASIIYVILESILKANNQESIPVIFNARFMLLRDYMGKVLAQVVPPAILGLTRLEIHEKALPMSLHIGVARIALRDGSVICDVIHDTTDSSRNMSVFVSIIYEKALFDYLQNIEPASRTSIGLSETLVAAFE